jgi:hypothetical protein
MKGYSAGYIKAIALLAQKIFESGILAQVQPLEIDWLDPWDKLTERFAELTLIAQAVENELDYELSYNQCCNAINLIYHCNPEEWKKLIDG